MIQDLKNAVKQQEIDIDSAYEIVEIINNDPLHIPATSGELWSSLEGLSLPGVEWDEKVESIKKKEQVSKRYREKIAL